MRRQLVSTVLAVGAAAWLSTAPPTYAEPSAPQPAPAAAVAGGAAGAAGPTCKSGVTGVDADGHVRSDTFVNERLVASSRSRARLSFDATAWGYYDADTAGRGDTIRLDVVAADGRPRQVTLERTRDSVRIAGVRGYAQQSFAPRLFADGYTYFAYTVNGDTMRRWALTRYADGSIRYAHPVRIASGMGELTSLQATPVQQVHGVRSELLYGTTAAGELLQFAVPLDHPEKVRTRRLLDAGLDGVTELSWSICNGKKTYHSFIAIDPTGNRATWLTVKSAADHPKAVLRAPVTGVSDWNVTAAY